MSSLYVQPKITKADEMSGLKISENWVVASIQLVGIHRSIIRVSIPKPFLSLQVIQPIMQGWYHKDSLLIGLHSQGIQVLIFKTSLPLGSAFNHTGMFAQGHLAALLSPPAKAFKFNINNGVFSETSRMGRTDKSHGMGNNGGYGQPGMLGNLLTVGKGTMNGIGMLSSLMGMGKFFFSGLIINP